MANALFSQTVSLVLFLGGAALLVGEALVPGAHLFVLGVALLSAGLVGLLLPATVPTAIAIAILAVTVLGATGLTLWGYRKLDIYGGGGSAQSLDSDALRGSFGRVTEEVTRTGGEVKLEDGGFNPYYQARAADGKGPIPVETEVMVVDPGGGNVLEVEPVPEDDDIDRELARGRAEESTVDRDRDTNSAT